MVWHGMVEVCEGAPVAVSGWVLADSGAIRFGSENGVWRLSDLPTLALCGQLARRLLDLRPHTVKYLKKWRYIWRIFI